MLKKITLDVRGMVCPYPSFMTVKKLSEVNNNTVLEIICDKIESTLNSVIMTLDKRGYKYEIEESSDKFIIKIYKSRSKCF